MFKEDVGSVGYSPGQGLLRYTLQHRGPTTDPEAGHSLMMSDCTGGWTDAAFKQELLSNKALGP